MFTLLGLQSCIVSSAIGIVAGTVEAGIGITGAVVGTTVGTAVDIIVPGGDKKESDEDEE